jgi:hypothetical protein
MDDRAQEYDAISGNEDNKTFGGALTGLSGNGGETAPPAKSDVESAHFARKGPALSDTSQTTSLAEGFDKEVLEKTGEEYPPGLETLKSTSRAGGRLPATAVQLPGLLEAARRVNHAAAPSESTSGSLQPADEASVPDEPSACEVHQFPAADRKAACDSRHIEVRAGGRGVFRPRSYEERNQKRYGLPGMTPNQPASGNSVERTELEAALARQRARQTISTAASQPKDTRESNH